MSSSSEIRAGRAYVELILREKIGQQLAQVGQTIRQWGNSLSGLGMKAFGGALPGPVQEIMQMAFSPAGAFVGFQTAAKLFAEHGHAIGEMAEKVGMTVEQVSALKYAAEASGVEMETLEHGIGKMQKSLIEAAQKGGEPLEAFRRLGLTVNDFDGKNTLDQLMMIAEPLARIEDPALRASLAFKIFGRGAQELFPLLAQGSHGIKLLMQEAERLGFVMGDKDAKAAAELWQQFRLVQSAAMGVVRSIGAAVAAMQGEMLDHVLSVLLAIRDWIKANQEAVASVAKIVGLVVAGGGALVFFGTILSGVATIFTAFATAAGVVATVMAFLLGTIPGIAILLTGLAGAGLGAMIGLEDLGKAWDWVVGKIQDSIAGVSGSINAIWNALTAGRMDLAWKVVTTGAAAAWAEVNLGFEEAWRGALNWLKEAFFGIWDAIRKYWYETIADFHTVWISVRESIVSGIFTVIETLWGSIVAVFANLAQMVSDNITAILENLPLGMAISPEEAAARRNSAEASAARQKADAKNILGDTRAARKADADRDLTEINRAKAAKTKAIDAEGDKRRKKAEEDLPHELAAAEDDANEALDAWKEAVKAAMAVQPEKKVPAPVKPGGVFDMESAGMKVAAAGTFSALGAEAMGRGGAIAEIVKQQQELNKKADVVVQWLAGQVAQGIKQTADAVVKLKNAVFK